MMITTGPILLLALSSATVPPASPAPETPIGVSPGGAAEAVAVGSRCPTFSWGVAGTTAESFELAAFRLDDGLDAEPVLLERLPGVARSWTPPLARCLAPEESYGWAVRAVEGGAAGEWSAVRLFAVPAGPSSTELEEALALVREHLGDRRPDPSSPPARTPVATVGLDAPRAPSSNEEGPGRVTAAAIASATEVGVQSTKADSDAVSFALYGLSHSDDEGSAGVVGETTAGDVENASASSVFTPARSPSWEPLALSRGRATGPFFRGSSATLPCFRSIPVELFSSAVFSTVSIVSTVPLLSTARSPVPTSRTTL